MWAKPTWAGRKWSFLPKRSPVTVVYKTDGGAVRGTVEKCASGPVLLIPQDTAQAVARISPRRAVRFQRSLRNYGVRPGEYYALAFAGDGPLPELDEGLLNRPAKSRFARAKLPGRTCARFRGSIEHILLIANCNFMAGDSVYFIHPKILTYE